MSVFDWIDMARPLDADGLEMYDGFFTSLDAAYLDRVGEAIHAAGFAMPMLCCSPDFTNPDPDGRKRALDREIEMIRVCRRLGGPKSVCRVLSGQRYPEVSREQGVAWVVECIKQAAAGRARTRRDPRHGEPLQGRLLEIPRVRPEEGRLPGARQRHSGSGAFRRAVRSFQRRSWPATIRSSCCGTWPTASSSMHASDRYLAEGATLDDLRQTDGTLGYSPNLRHGVTGKGLNDYDAIFRILAEHGYTAGSASRTA